MKDNNIKGLGFSEVLFLIFLTLKLCKIINWSWLWIFSPLWISIGFWLLIYIICKIIYLLNR